MITNGNSRLTAPIPAVLSSYTREDHKRRIEKIGICEQGIRNCRRKHFIFDYIPGQAVLKLFHVDWAYQPGWEPSEEDEQDLLKLKEHGIGLVQVWNKWANIWHGQYISAASEKGFRKLIDLVHKHGMKIIPYTCTNYFARYNLDLARPNEPEAAFRPEWALPESYDLIQNDLWHLAHCSDASPGWRAHILPAISRIMDDYGVDGLYNDAGYMRPGDFQRKFLWDWDREKPQDDASGFREGYRHDGAAGDMWALIYEQIKRRGGIYKLHLDGMNGAYTDTKAYDYLWVGEGVKDIDFLRQTCLDRDYAPYIVPQRDTLRLEGREEELYLSTIPFMQFTFFPHGKDEGHTKLLHSLYKKWIQLYLQMVEEGTWAWLDIKDSDLLINDLPKDVVMSSYANREMYLVLANFQRRSVELETNGTYVDMTVESPTPASRWALPARSLIVLKHVQ